MRSARRRGLAWAWLLVALLLLPGLPTLSGHVLVGAADQPTSSPAAHPSGAVEARPHRTLGQRPAYSAEPAPMGVADYGIGPSGDLSYASSSFNGTATVSFLSVLNQSLGPKQADLTFQLNLNLVFENGGKNYTYWVQNVAYFDTTTSNVSMFDNIWNSSGPASMIYPSSVAGKGTVQGSGAGSYYFDAASAVLPGNDVELTQLEARISLYAVAFVGTNGTPEVSMLYDDGQGDQTYDEISFPFAAHLEGSPSFLVDGSVLTPVGNFYDAEFVMGGPGDGSTTTLSTGTLELSLSYWNGNNYETVPDSSNYGSDTSESISNVSALSAYYSWDGQMVVDIQAGAGGLGENWQSDQLAVVGVDPGGPSTGSVLEAGFAIPFVGGQARFAVWPGSFLIQVNLSGTLETCGTYDVVANVTTEVICPGAYAVSFEEQGLPNGTDWSVTIGNVTQSGGTAALTFAEPNGSYAYRVGPVPGFTTASYHGNVTVLDGAPPTTLVWAEFLLPVVVGESGLPLNSSWSVSVQGISYPTNSAQIHLVLPNGSYAYSVSTVFGYDARNSTGRFSVNGTPVHLDLRFVAVVFLVTFEESGLPSGASWNVTFGNQSTTVYGVVAQFLSANGSLDYRIANSHGLQPDPAEGTVIVAGHPVNVSISFQPTGPGTLSTITGLILGGPGLVGAAAVIGLVAGLWWRRRAASRTPAGPKPAGGPPPRP